MKQKALEAAQRLQAYFATLGEGGEIAYPEDADPEEDARLVREALEGE